MSNNRNPSGWLPNVGPFTVQSDGVALPRRGTINYVESTESGGAEDDPDNDRTNIPRGSGGSSLSTDNGSAPQAADQISTTDDTPTNIGDPITLATDSITTIDLAVQCIQIGAAKAKVFSVRRSFLNDGGTVEDGTQIDLIAAEELGGSLAASLAITRTGTTAQPKATGVAATALRWYLISQSMTVAAASAGPVPDAPTAITPDTGPTSGGTVVQITVPSSTGLIGAKIGGVALTSFSIVNGTTVQGTTGAHAAGVEGVVVTNINGDSAALAEGFSYESAEFDASSVGTVHLDLDSRFVEVTGETTVTQMTDQSGNNHHATPPGGQNPTLEASNASYGGKPAIRFEGNDILITPVGSGTIAEAGGHSAITIAIVGHLDADEAAVNGFTFQNNGIGGVALRGSGPSTPTWQAVANSATALATSAKAADSPCITILVLAPGGTWKIYRNSKTAENLTMADCDLSGGTSQFQIGNFDGAPGPDYVHDGPLCRVIVWTGAMSNGNVGTALDGLGALYGIAISP